MSLMISFNTVVSTETYKHRKQSASLAKINYANKIFIH